MIVHNSVKGIFVASIVLMAVSIYIYTQNQKDKNEYEKITGEVVYYSNEYSSYPKRH